MQIEWTWRILAGHPVHTVVLLLFNCFLYFNRWRLAVNKLEREVGEVVFLQTQTSPYFQLREKFKCIIHIGKSETLISLKSEDLSKTSPSVTFLASTLDQTMVLLLSTQSLCYPVISRCRSQHVVSVESSSLFHHNIIRNVMTILANMQISWNMKNLILL